MLGQKRLRDYGLTIGTYPPGPKNSITDVPGVRVGHVTLNDGPVKTGVTAVLPHPGNLFRDKVLAAAHVINGFGKTMGLIQIEELGTIETPILLTNTLSIGTVSDALIRYMLDQNPEIGDTTGTVNPVVCECNDMYLNDIRGQHVRPEHVYTALDNAAVDFLEGAVGAGTGMTCYGLKGGIGTASRQLQAEEQIYTIGALVLSNFGRADDFRLGDIPAGHLLAQKETQPPSQPDKGSIIILLATDLPATERQLKRLAKRAAVGLARTGSYIGNGSGDIALAFTTAGRVRHDEPSAVTTLHALNENRIDDAFRAVTEATEEAVLNSMICADTTTGRNGHTRQSLREHIDWLLKQR